MAEDIEDIVATEEQLDRRRRLFRALRAEQLLIEWDFSDILNECGTVGCAIGMAIKLWPETCRELFWKVGPTGFFGITFQQRALFLFPQFYGLDDNDYDSVTPAMVADALEATLP